MKAGVIVEKNVIELQEVEMPELSAGELLIKVKYCGICGTDIHVLHGAHPTAKFPVIPGHEFVGEVAQIHKDTVTAAKVGDLVAAQPVISCGNCAPCAKGRDNVCEHLQIVGVHCNGGFAEYVKVMAKKVYVIPKETDIKVAALAEPLAVAVHDVRRSGLSVGEKALVIGGGPIGLLIALVARHTGADSVVISEISQFRRDAAEKMGFKTLNPLADNFESEIMELTGQKGFDVVYEVSGSRPGIVSAVKYARITGTIMVIGMTSEPYPVDLAAVFAKELELKGVRIHAQYNFMGALELIKSGVMNEQLSQLISEVYPLKDVAEAFAYAGKGDTFFKILVEM